MSTLRDLTSEVSKLLDTVLPKNVRCVFVLYDADTQSVSTASDMSDQDATILLEDAIDVLKNPEESASFKNEVDVKTSN